MNLNRIVTLLLFASIWGMLEAVLGGALHLARVPFTGTIMASIGFAILFAALRRGVQPSQLVALSLIAASFKWLDCLFFGLAPIAITVVNPAVAIATQGLAFALVAHGLGATDRRAAIAPRMLGAAAISLVAFNAISLVAFGWPTNQSQHPVNTALLQLPLIAIGATLLARGATWLDARLPRSLPLLWQASATAACVTIMLVAHAIR